MNRPVRLLLFCGAREWGGAEIVLGHLLAGLGDSVDASLLGVDRAVLARIAQRRHGTRWSVVPRIRDKRDVAAIRAHRRAIAVVRPDIVQLNLPVPFADPYSVLAAVTIPRVRVIAVEHLPLVIPSRGVRLLRRGTAGRLAAHLAVGTDAARTIERDIGLRSGSIEVVPNGVPVPARSPGAADIRPPSARFVIGAVGRLHRQKGFDVLLHAVQLVPDAHLVLVGDGPERPALEGLAAELRITDRLTMTGWRDDVADCLRWFDVVAMPSRFEGLPLVVLEAMLSARPVVTTRVGSIGDAVDEGRNGLIVPVDDAVALAVALRRLQDDPALRQRLGAAAADVAQERFTITAMTACYEQVYRRVLDAG